MQPPRVHTVGFIADWTSSLKALWTSGRTSTVATLAMSIARNASITYSTLASIMIVIDA